MFEHHKDLVLHVALSGEWELADGVCKSAYPSLDPPEGVG